MSLESEPTPGACSTSIATSCSGRGGPQSPLFPWALGAAVALAGCLAFLLHLNPIAASDFWWQLAAGEWILHNRAIPTRDPYSWTAADRPWHAHEWLTEVLFALAWRTVPADAWVAYKAGLGVVACGLVGWRTFLRTRRPYAALAAGLAVAPVLRNYADLRPQMFSFVLLGLVLLLLERRRLGCTTRLMHWLPPLFCLWANLHGGVLVGLLVLLLWTIGTAFEAASEPERQSECRELGLVSAVCLIAVLVNPAGFQLYAYPFTVLRHPAVMDYISEWFSPNFHQAHLRPVLWLLVTLVVVAGAAPRGGAERRLGEWLGIGALVYGALLAQRNTVVLAIAALPAATSGCLALVSTIAPLCARRAGVRISFGRWGAEAAAILTLVLLLRAAWPAPPSAGWFAQAIGLSSFPVQAADRLAAGEWPGRMYNDYVWGGYLLWRLGPRQRVFIDGRAEVYYGTGAFEDEMTLHTAAPGWREVLDRREIRVVVTHRSQALAAALGRESGWRLAFQGPVEAVFVRGTE